MSADKERLYFLNKYTTGKANDVIKGFVTLNSDDSYKRAKKLLAQRFGDPHRISNAYKVRLRNWPQISKGDSSAVQTLSDFFQFEEAMSSIEFLKDLNSTEALRQVSSKFPSYSGVKWCRSAFDTKKRSGRVVTFHDLVKFVESEADLATDLVFSPDMLKAERRKVPDKSRSSSNRRRPSDSNSFATTADQTQDKISPNIKNKQTRACPMCSKPHALQNCDEFVKNRDERLEFIQSKGICLSCLNKGHYSKDCRRRLTCKICGNTHPTILHSPKDAKVPNDQEELVERKNRKEAETNSEQVVCICSSVSHSIGE